MTPPQPVSVEAAKTAAAVLYGSVLLLLFTLILLLPLGLLGRAVSAFYLPVLFMAGFRRVYSRILEFPILQSFASPLVFQLVGHGGAFLAIVFALAEFENAPKLLVATVSWLLYWAAILLLKGLLREGSPAAGYVTRGTRLSSSDDVASRLGAKN